MNFQAADAGAAAPIAQATWKTLVDTTTESGAGPSPFHSLERYVYSGGQKVLVAHKGSDVVVFVKSESVAKSGPVRLLKSQATVPAMLDDDPITLAVKEAPEEEGYFPTSPVRYARFRR